MSKKRKFYNLSLVCIGGKNIENLGQPTNIDTYEEENKQLQQQLVEKDLEIKKLKYMVLEQEAKNQDQRHQICEKIREFVELNEDWGTIFVCQIYEFLKEIEKGE